MAVIDYGYKKKETTRKYMYLTTTNDTTIFGK